MKKRVNITLDEKLIKKFQEYCKKRGMKVSSKIEILIKKEIQNK